MSETLSNNTATLDSVIVKRCTIDVASGLMCFMALVFVASIIIKTERVNRYTSMKLSVMLGCCFLDILGFILFFILKAYNNCNPANDPNEPAVIRTVSLILTDIFSFTLVSLTLGIWIGFYFKVKQMA